MTSIFNHWCKYCDNHITGVAATGVCHRPACMAKARFKLEQGAARDGFQPRGDVVKRDAKLDTFLPRYAYVSPSDVRTAELKAHPRKTVIVNGVEVKYANLDIGPPWLKTTDVRAVLTKAVFSNHVVPSADARSAAKRAMVEYLDEDLRRIVVSGERVWFVFGSGHEVRFDGAQHLYVLDELLAEKKVKSSIEYSTTGGVYTVRWPAKKVKARENVDLGVGDVHAYDDLPSCGHVHPGSCERCIP